MITLPKHKILLEYTNKNQTQCLLLTKQNFNQFYYITHNNKLKILISLPGIFIFIHFFFWYDKIINNANYSVTDDIFHFSITILANQCNRGHFFLRII